MDKKPRGILKYSATTKENRNLGRGAIQKSKSYEQLPSHNKRKDTRDRSQPNLKRTTFIDATPSPASSESRIPRLSTSYSPQRRSVSDDRDSKIPQPITYYTSPRRAISSSPPRKARPKRLSSLSRRNNAKTNIQKRNLNGPKDKSPISAPKIPSRFQLSSTESDSDGTLRESNQQIKPTDLKTATYVTQETPEGITYIYPVVPYPTSPEDSGAEQNIVVQSGDLSISSEISTHSSQNVVVRAVINADQSLQNMSSTINLPVTDGHSWYRVAKVLDESAGEAFDRIFDSALTDSAKCEALRNEQEERNVVYSQTYPMNGEPVDRVNIVVEDERHNEEEVCSRSLHSPAWTLSSTGEMSNSLQRKQMEVLEHSISCTTHILRPKTASISDIELTDDGAETDEDQRNLTTDSCMTEPEIPEQSVTLDNRTSKYKKSDYIFSQPPRYPRRLPIVPKALADTVDWSDDEDDQPTNPELMTKFINSNRDTPPNNASLSLRPRDGATPQPGYLRDYQQYLESVDGTLSGRFTPAQEPPEETLSRSEVDNSQTTSTSRLSSTTTIDTVTHADANDTVKHVISVQSLNDQAKWASSRNSIDKGRGFISLPNSRPHSAMGKPWMSLSQDITKDYTPARVSPVLSRTFPIENSKANTVKTTKDFAQQTMTTNGTQTPVKIKLSENTMTDALVIDVTGVRHAVSLGIEPWDMLGPRDFDIKSSRDFSTQTFGQFYDNYHSHISTQTDEVDTRPAVVMVDCFTQTLNDRTTQTSPIAGLMALYQNIENPPNEARVLQPSPSKLVPPANSCNSFSGFQQGMYSKVSVPPPQSTVSEESEQVENVSRHQPSTERLSRKDRHYKSKKEIKKPDKSRDRSMEIEDNQSVLTSRTNSSRKDILKFMLKQVKDLKQKLDPEGVESEKVRKKSKSKSRSPSKNKVKEYDSAIESLGEDGEVDDKLYSRKHLEKLYSRPMSGINPERDIRRNRPRRAHSVESFHSDDGSRERAHNKLREEYFYARRSPRREYPSPNRYHEQLTRYGREILPSKFSHNRGHSPLQQQRAPRRVLPQRPMPSQHPGYPPQQMHQPPPPRYTPNRMHPMTPVHQQYVSPQVPLMTTPVFPGQGLFRPISTQPMQQMTPGTPMMFVQNEAPVQNSPHPPYIVLASPANKFHSDSEMRQRSHSSLKTRPSSAQAAYHGLDNSFSKVSRAAKEMKSLTRRMTDK